MSDGPVTEAATRVHECPDCKCGERAEFGSIEDGFGNEWLRCALAAACRLQVVRPGKVQCDRCEAS